MLRDVRIVLKTHVCGHMSTRAPLAAHARSRLDAVLAAGMARLAVVVPTGAGEKKRVKRGKEVAKPKDVQDDELDALDPEDLDELAELFEQQDDPSGVRRAPLQLTGEASELLLGLVMELIQKEGKEGNERSMSSREISARMVEIAREMHERYPTLPLDQLHAHIRDKRKRYSPRRIGNIGGRHPLPEDPMAAFTARDVREVKELLKPPAPPPRPPGRVPQRKQEPRKHLNLISNAWMVPEVANLPEPPPIPEGKSSGGKGPSSKTNQRKWTHAENAYVYWYVMHPWELEKKRQREAMMLELQCEKAELQKRVRRIRQYVENAHPGTTLTPDLMTRMPPEDDPLVQELLNRLPEDDPQTQVVSRTLPAPSPPPPLL